ncbi:hypothetical protein D9M72_547800 [compost metagenome]
MDPSVVVLPRVHRHVVDPGPVRPRLPVRLVVREGNEPDGGRTRPPDRRPSRGLQVRPRAGVQDSAAVQRWQRLPEGVRPVVEHMVVGKRYGIDARRGQDGRVAGVRAEMEHFPRLRRPAVGQDAFEVGEPDVPLCQDGEGIAPGEGRRDGPELPVHQAAQHHVTQEYQAHGPPPAPFRRLLLRRVRL